MNKVALIADLHLGARRNNEYFMKSMLNFFKNEFEPYLRKNEIDTIFILGDVLDHRESTNTKVLNLLYEIFSVILKDYKVHIILGNHDIYYKTNIETHSLVFLKTLPNIILYEEITKTEIKGKEFLFIPWQVDNSFLNKLPKADVCLGHLDLNGFKLNKYSISDDGINDNKFSKFKRTYLGHFHTRSKKVLKNGSIIEYIGSPYHLTRNDTGDLRGFSILDLDNMEIDFRPVKTTIRYIEYTYPDLPKTKDIKNNIIDVYVKIDSAFKENQLNAKIREIEKHNPLNVNIFPIYDFVNKHEEYDGDVQRMNLEKMISNYIEKLSKNQSPKLISKLETTIHDLKERLKTDD